MGFFLLVIVLALFASLVNQIDRDRIDKDYEEWRRNQR